MKELFLLLVVMSAGANARADSEPAKIGSIVLLQPDSEMTDRVRDATSFSAFVREIVHSVSSILHDQAKKVPESGWITVGIKPPSSTKFWISFKSLAKDRLLIKKIETNLTNVPCPKVKGNVAVSIYLNLFGDKSAPPSEPMLKGAVPVEWRGRHGRIPDEIFKQVWP